MRIPHSDEGNYEEVGNYVYSISPREFQKIALGLALPMVAFKDFHDIYIEGVEKEKLDNKSESFKKIKRGIFVNEIKCKIGLSTRNHISAIIFKKMPSVALESRLSELGFRTIKLPQNPYIWDVKKGTKPMKSQLDTTIDITRTKIRDLCQMT